MTDMSDHQWPTVHYLGICDECRRVKQFNSREARDEWETTHQHEEEPK